VRGAARERLPHADVLWALEQALKSGHVGAVLAWLPARLKAEVLRRLQLAAHAHEGPAFLLREQSAQSRPSPAPLRLLLQPAGVDGLSVRLLKRRGPALPQALQLRLPPVLPMLQRSRAEPSAGEQPVPQPLPQAPRPSFTSP
jgi:protein ImuA